jgi:hypothetical protein
MADIGWARSLGDRAEGQGLRRGAWYRLVEDSKKDWVVVDVARVEIRVPKEDLEIRRQAPMSWSVVRQPHLVCPGCCTRAVIPEGMKDAKCNECGRVYPIDWKDSA